MRVKPDRPVTADVSRYLGAGLTWALATLLFLVVGAWLGERLGSRSVGALIGAFVGAAAGFAWMVRQLTPPGQAGAAERRGRGGQAGAAGSGPAQSEGSESGPRSARRPRAQGRPRSAGSGDASAEGLSGFGNGDLDADGDVKGKRDA